MSGPFLNNLRNFARDTINDETVELVQPYFEMEDYTLENGKKVCGNVAGLLSWTKAMVVFYGVNREVLPLKVIHPLLLCVCLPVAKERRSRNKTIFPLILERKQNKKISLD